MDLLILGVCAFNSVSNRRFTFIAYGFKVVCHVWHPPYLWTIKDAHCPWAEAVSIEIYLACLQMKLLALADTIGSLIGENINFHNKIEL